MQESPYALHEGTASDPHSSRGYLSVIRGGPPGTCPAANVYAAPPYVVVVLADVTLLITPISGIETENYSESWIQASGTAPSGQVSE